MSRAQGLYVSPTEFMSFADAPAGFELGREIATRNNRPDFFAIGDALLPNPDAILKSQGKDIEIYRKLRTESQVGGNIRRRKGAVRALEWGLGDSKDVSPKEADETRRFLKDLDMDRIISEMLDATLYGYQPMEVIWGKVGSYIVPVDIVGKPAEWFCFDTANQLRLRTQSEPNLGELLPEMKFLCPRQNPSYDNPYGFPDLSMVFWPVTFKKGGFKFWVTFAEKFGSPWVVGKQPRGTDVKQTDIFLDAIAQMVQDAVAVIPDDASVEIKEPLGKAESAGIYQALIAECRTEINYALLGQNQSSEATSTRASAEVGFKVSHEIRDADANLVTHAMNQLLRWVHALNFTGAPCQFKMWEQSEIDDTRAKRDKTLAEAGARFTNDYWARAYELEDGDLADPVLPTQPGTNQGVVKNPSETAFAEGDAPNEGADPFPDQEALDAALADFMRGQLQPQAEAMLRPLLSRLEACEDYAEGLAALAELFPKMPTDQMTQTLEHAWGATLLWGHANEAQG